MSIIYFSQEQLPREMESRLVIARVRGLFFLAVVFATTIVLVDVWAYFKIVFSLGRDIFHGFLPINTFP